MGEHGWFDKRFMYEESLNTPLVMMLPKGLNARGEINEMVQNIDYAPTFLELAGAPIPADMDGVSLVPLLKGEHPKDWRKAIYYHYYEYPAEHSVKRHYGVRDSRYKLIHFYRDIDVWELYDLQNDPQELHNIYGQKGTEKSHQAPAQGTQEIAAAIRRPHPAAIPARLIPRAFAPQQKGSLPRRSGLFWVLYFCSSETNSYFCQPNIQYLIHPSQMKKILLIPHRFV